MKNKLLKKLEGEIRNVKIATTYQVMVMYTDLRKSQIVTLLAKNYFLSSKRIESIVREYSD